MVSRPTRLTKLTSSSHARGSGFPAIAFALPLLVAACAPGDAERAADEMDAGTASAQEQVTQRIPQFENDEVEVWKSIIMPNQPLTMHRHDHPRTIIALKGGTLRITNDAGVSHDVQWETGSAYWLDADPPGEMHGDQNPGPDPVEVIVVQMKNVGYEGG